MKLSYKLLIILVLPLQLFAQDTTVLKRQANILAKAVVKGDYETLINHMYPKAVQSMGGKKFMIDQAKKGFQQLKAQGISFESATVGSPGKFYKAGTEIHCLVPETIMVKTPNGRISAKSNLLAISGDKGKTWTFLDLNSKTISTLPKMFPNFNNNLKIPQPLMSR